MNRAVMLSSLNVESTDKISVLLRDTVLLLCRNGFNFQLDIKIQGLIAVTLDEKEVYLVKFDESECRAPTESLENNLIDEVLPEETSSQQSLRKCGRRKRNRLRGGVMQKPEVGFEPREVQSDACKETHVVDVDDTSTVSVKEEFDQFATVNETNDNPDVGHHVPTFGVTGTGLGNHGDDILWSLPNISGRGRRARRSGQKMYSCEHPGCGLSFYRSYTLYRHQRLKHGQRLVPRGNQLNKNGTEFRCPMDGCGQVFVRTSILEKHSREVHGQNEVHLMGSDGYLGKMDGYEESDLLFEGMEYGLLSR